ncbi:MAG TPA: AAA-like domain-containing protein [Anaerolineae bacterium]|nr:AAA-like domain-containing protein [Anaerolineae bacterium]
MRFFNTAGPTNCQKHYCVPPLTRFNLDDILGMINRERYFVLHAPRQVGKTTYLLALMDYINSAGRYRCLYVNVELAQSAREDVNAAMRAILNELALQARLILQDDTVAQAWPEILERAGGHAALSDVLTHWCERSDKPLVLMIDEIDALIGDTLIAVLRQLRAGYPKRPALFPQSVILCGVRDVRDYRIHSSRTQEIITGGSAFNIKAESLRMDDFDQAEVELLFRQHSKETGQPITDEALALVWELTQGQPWLVNALGWEACFKLPAARDRRTAISAEIVQEAKEQLILRRETHLDQLVDKLREPRVQAVIGPMLEGAALDQAVPPDHIQYVIDMGLIRRGASGLEIANPIYREVIPRELSFVSQLSFESTSQPAWYLRPDGSLEMPKLLAAFQQFFREHSESWLERFQYHEAGPQLLLQAFLQRIVNGGGRVEREYGLGKRRTDLLVIWPYAGGVQRVVIELKVLYRSLKQTIGEGLEQTWAYMDATGAPEGHLVIFDRTPGKAWEEKVFQRQESYRSATIAVWGM